MTILYSCITFNSNVIVEASTTTGNFNTIVQSLLTQPISQDKMTFKLNGFLIHYVQKNEYGLICMSEESFGRRIPFAFLFDLSSQFQGFHTNQKDELESLLLRQMHIYSSPESQDKFTMVQSELDQVKQVMVTNIEKVLERGERIEVLVDKTDHLNQTSFAFKKRSTALRRQMWWKNQKLVLMIVCIGILGVYFFVSSVCGFPGWKECLNHS